MKNNIFSISTLVLLLPVAALSFTSGCANAQTVAPPTETAPEKPAPAKPTAIAVPDKIVTEADAGKTATIKIGQRLLVRLPSNPTTGYEWSVAKIDDKILAPDGESQFDVPETPLPGAPTVQTLFFKAKSAGKIALELKYARPWETDAAPAKAYKVTINIVE